MKIKLFAKIKNNSYLNDVQQLLIMCDHEFVPPLSCRTSTIQSDLSPGINDKQIPEEYFNIVCEQSAVLAIFDNKVIGFMSYRTNYICEHIAKRYLPNIYVTTVIVHPDFRHRGIAGLLYSKIIRSFPKHYLFTRTWSTNISHIRVLRSFGFHEHCYLDNDRGEGIDTVYYQRQPTKKQLKSILSNII